MLDRTPLAGTRGIMAHGNDKAVDSGNGLVEAAWWLRRKEEKPILRRSLCKILSHAISSRSSFLNTRDPGLGF